MVIATRLAEAFKAHNLGRIVRLVVTLGYHPFGGALLLSPAALVDGTHLTFRVLNVFYFAVSIFLLVWLCWNDDRVSGVAAMETATLVGMLTVSAPPMLFYSTAIVLEPCGFLVVTLVLCLHALSADSDHRSTTRLMTGTLCALAIFIKFNIGLPLVVALLVHAAATERSWQSRISSVATLAIGSLAPVLIWLALAPRAMGGLREMFVNRSSDLPGLQGQLYYIVALCASYTAPWIGLAIVVLLPISAALWRDARYGAAVIYGLLSVAMLTLHPMKDVRFLYNVAPFLFLGTVVVGRRIAINNKWLAGSRPALRQGVIVILVLSCLGQILTVLAWREPLLEHPERKQAVQFLENRLPCDRPVYITGTFNELWHDLILWRLAKQCGVAIDDLRFTRLGGVGGEWRVKEATYDLAAYQGRLDAIIESNRRAVFVSVELSPASIFWTQDYRDYEAWQRQYPMLLDGYAGEGRLDRDDVSFRGSNLSINIYREDR